MTQNKTLVTLLLDRSGSMKRIQEQTVTGINAWLESLKASTDDMRFSLVQFDAIYERGDEAVAAASPHHAAWNSMHFKIQPFPNVPPIQSPVQPAPFGQFMNQNPGMFGSPASRRVLKLEKTYDMVRVKDIPAMKVTDLDPRGDTPLVDAAVKTIHAISAAVSDRPDIKVVLAIQTDGLENASTEHSWDELRALVAQKEIAGWQILFMGAGINAYDQASRMGVSAEKTISYGLDRAQTRAAFASTGAQTCLYSSGLSANMAYSARDKMAAGDAFAKGI